MKIMEAMYRRRSVRKYSPEPLPETTLAEIREHIRQAERLHPDVGLEVHIIDQEASKQIFTGLIGTYGKIVAPHYMVVTAEEKAGCRENAGYVMEQAVLRLAMMGIGTCWIGGSFKRGAVKEIVPLRPGYIPVVIVAFGTPAEADGQLRRPEEAKRLAMPEIISGTMEEGWQPVMEAVRLAPSAVNSQPWRFAFDGKMIHAFAARPGFLMKGILGALNEVDMGIGLAHLMLASRESGRPIEWRTVQPAAGLKPKDARYVMSGVEN